VRPKKGYEKAIVDKQLECFQRQERYWLVNLKTPCTEDDALRIGRLLMDWVELQNSMPWDNPSRSFFIADFCFSNDISPHYLFHHCDAYQALRDAVSLARQFQEFNLIKGALLKKLDSTIARYLIGQWRTSTLGDESSESILRKDLSKFNQSLVDLHKEMMNGSEPQTD